MPFARAQAHIEFWPAVPFARLTRKGGDNDVCSGGGYGIAISVAPVALMQLSSVARPLVVARSSRRRIREGKPLCPDWNHR